MEGNAGGISNAPRRTAYRVLAASALAAMLAGPGAVLAGAAEVRLPADRAIKEFWQGERDFTNRNSVTLPALRLTAGSAPAADTPAGGQPLRHDLAVKVFRQGERDFVNR